MTTASTPTSGDGAPDPEGAPRVAVVDQNGNEITTIMPFQEPLVGNVNLPALHGGAIGAFLELTSVIQLPVRPVAPGPGIGPS